MKLWMIAPEVSPLSRTGGLAEVVGSLPAALAGLGLEVTVVSPRYRSVGAAGVPLETLDVAPELVVGGRPIRLSVEQARTAGAPVRHLLVRHDPFFDREHLYGTPAGDYPDNLARFVALSRGALEVAAALGERPDILHAHDWQAALVPVYARTLYAAACARARTVLTVHNLAYQGIFPDHEFPATGLDWRRFNWRELEYYGRVNLLKGGLVYADAITTVSPSYARQIRRPEFGCGLDGVLRARSDDLFGVINGADYALWNPGTDPHLPHRYVNGTLDGKAACKAALQRELGLAPDPRVPLFGMVGRFAEQKGFDLVVRAAPELAATGVQVAILGSGDASIAQRVAALPSRFPSVFAVRVGFDEPLSRRILAGADAFLMPSIYEPCGLSQLYAMRYGAVPVVRSTGGLADTVTPETGFGFEAADPSALAAAVRSAAAAYQDRERWARLVRAAMRQDFSWDRSAREYADLYRRVAEAPARAPAVL